ncbi:single-pass membrane and coiled-coil domain-containing protein 4 isoform X2 [Prionailurus bengalensis]|uniref:single-pass membrane and coiled-coil domain-containing protein 4 isoform X2 n=1 Tax=Prionailurus bengalensis TaxID=37029 RepID=UPI001CA93461|nr:single-pass membrane and coiled-coil domain-containing protein 4 isoform X2 [Prionailurus bengalensis]
MGSETSVGARPGRGRGPGRRRWAEAEVRAGAAGELGLGREDAASRRQRAPGAAVRRAGAARAGAERRGEARRGGERERRRPLPRIPGSGGGGGGGGGGTGGGITQVTFTGNQFAESLETAVLGVEEKEVVRLDQRSVARPSKPSPDAFLASPGKDAAAQRQAQEGDVQGQEGAEAGHAGGPTADHHGGAAHAGRGRASDRGVRVRGHAPHRHRVSAVGGLPKQAVEAREGEGQRNMALVSRDFPDAELRAGAPCLLWSLT